MPILSDNIILKLLADVKDAKAKLSDISGQVDDLQDKTTGVNKTFSQLGKIAKVAISAVLIRKGAQALKRFGDQATRAFGAFEQSEQSFQVLVGNITQANELMKDLMRFADQTPFSDAQVQGAAKALLGYGRSAEQTRDEVRRLGEVAAATGGDLQQISTIYGRVAAMGKVSTRDTMSFISAGVPIYEILGTHLEKSTAQLQELQTQGKLTFKDLEAAFQSAGDEGGKFFGALERQANTVTGVLNTMEGEIDNIFVALGEKMAPAIKEFGRTVTTIAAQIVEWVENIDNDFVAKIAAALRAVGENFTSFTDLLQKWAELSKHHLTGVGVAFESWAAKVNHAFQRTPLTKAVSEMYEKALRAAEERAAKLQGEMNTGWENFRKGFGESYQKALEDIRADMAKEQGDSPIVNSLLDLDSSGNLGKKTQKRIDTALNEIVKTVLRAYGKAQLSLLGGSMSAFKRTTEMSEEAKILGVLLSKDIAKWTAQELRNFQQYVKDELGSDSVTSLILEGYIKDAEGKAINMDLVGRLQDRFNKAMDRQKKKPDERSWFYRLLGLEGDQIEGFQEASAVLLDSARQLTNALVDEELRRNDLLIRASQDRLYDLQRIAGEGNAEQLQLEEQRHRALLEEREKYIQRQRELNAIEITANNAVTVSNMIKGLSDAFKTGNIIGGIAYSLAAAGTIAATIASVGAALSNVPAYETGTTFVQGDGGIDNVPAMLTRGERVVDKRTNATLNKWGVGNEDLIPLIGLSLGKIMPASLGAPAIGSSKDFQRLEAGLKRVERAVDRIRIDVNIDEDGIGIAAGHYNNKQNRIKRLMS